MATTTLPRGKPRLRGVSHEIAFFFALVGGGVLVARAPDARAGIAGAIYAVTLAAMFGISALYHRPQWSARALRRMRRLDHATIFLFIAGTFTPLSVLALRGRGGGVFLWAIWAGAVTGITVGLLWHRAPRWIRASLYVTLGWFAVAALPALYASLGAGAVALIVGGGLLYTLGAVTYALQWPDPLPRTFGYHEVFHALVIAACLCHFGVVARVILAG